MSRAYGEDGFIPTVCDHEWDGNTLILETTDNRQETDLALTDDGIERVGDTKDEESQEKLALWERN